MTIANPELQLAEEFVLHTRCSVFLTGKAGTGKTTFLHNIKKQTHKRLVVTAPTGVAAINAGGVTLHSFFQLPFGPFLPGDEVHSGHQRFSRDKKNIIRSLDLLVIDEVSMVRADLLDSVDTVLRRYRRCELPFGGVQLLMIGDLHQLSPVVKGAEWQLLEGTYDSPYFFSSIALRRTEVIPIELKHIYRQSDGRFIELLNRVRDNTLDPSSLQQLNCRYIPGFSPGDDEGYITLCTHNAGADAINQARLKALAGKSRCYDAEVEGTFPEHAYPTAACLELKTGAQVMFVRNDMAPEKRYFNGKIGKIVRMTSEAVEVRCPEDAEAIDVTPVIWENIEYTVDPETAEISQKIVGTFKQLPLKPAWAITIHKSQGLTFDRAIIDARAAFAHGQVYVALSRCRTFDGLVLSSPLAPLTVKTDQTVLRFVAEAEQRLPTPEQLAAAKIQYQRHLLLECFDFQPLQRQLARLTGLLRGNARVIQVAGTGEIGAIQQRVAAEIYTVGENFKRQLLGLFGAAALPSGDPVILDRLARASVYFQDKLTTILTPYLEGLTVDTDNREIRKKINDTLRQLREEAAVKLAAVRSCRDGFSPAQYLRAVSLAAIDPGERGPKEEAITYSEADVGHPELFRKLREWRAKQAAEEGVPHYQVLHQKALVQIAVHLPDTVMALRRIKGIGKQLAGRYGAALTAMVAEYRRAHRIESVSLPLAAGAAPVKGGKKESAGRGHTKEISLEMFRKGMTVPQIARERGLVPQTIEGHLAFFVKTGRLAISDLLADDRRREIEQKIAGLIDQSLGELKAALGDDYSYGELNLVLAHRAHLEEL